VPICQLNQMEAGRASAGRPGRASGKAAAAVLLQAEVPLEGVDDRLDSLPRRPHRTKPDRLVAASRVHQHRSQAGLGMSA
jgi:hypothetical protein